MFLCFLFKNIKYKMSIIKLNPSAKSWYPSSKNMPGKEIDQIMRMTYEEFKHAILADTLPVVIPIKKENKEKNEFSKSKPLLLRDTNNHHSDYIEWAYSHRDRLKHIDINELFVSSPYSFIPKKYMDMDQYLEEIYENENAEWNKKHEELFQEEDEFLPEWMDNSISLTCVECNKQFSYQLYSNQYSKHHLCDDCHEEKENHL